MLGLISLRFFAQSGHIDAFRSIVGEAPEAGIEPAVFLYNLLESITFLSKNVYPTWIQPWRSAGIAAPCAESDRESSP